MQMKANTSYKIKCKEDELFNVLMFIKNNAQSSLVNLCKNYYKSIMTNPPKGLKRVDPMHCMMHVIDKLRVKKPEEIFSSINVGLFVYKIDSSYFFSPYCSFLGAELDDVFSFVVKMDNVEETKVSESLKDVSKYLVINICDYNTWFDQLDPWIDMMRDFLSNLSPDEKRSYLDGISV